MDELLAQFLIEAPELVQQGSDALLALERTPADRSQMDDAFRAIHTLKGSVGLFDLPAMGASLHAAEDVLGAVRAGVRAADPDTVDALLAVLTQIERWLRPLERGVGLPDDAAEVARRLADQLGAVRTAPSGGAGSTAVPDWALALGRLPAPPDALTAIRYTPAEGAYFSGDDPVGLLDALPGLVHLRLGLREDGGEGPADDPFACRLVLDALTRASVAEARAVLRFVPDQVEIIALPGASRDGVAPPVVADGPGAARTLRVDAGRMEALSAMVDELVAARAALADLATQARAGSAPVDLARALTTQSERLDRLTGQMHRQVAALRMTPVAPLLRRLPRVVRDLARALGREVDFVVQDNGVEADRAIIEGLFEPLTHLLRNALDHGIERPETRLATGKPRQGTIRLTAQAEGGRLDLTLSDDGAGMDPQILRDTAHARGLMSQAAVAALSDAEAVNLIFLPGFSTAAALTEVSGRGVGMDAVKTSVQTLGGHIRIDSAPGQGAVIRITLPLSLTLTKLMVVVSDGEAWGVPMDRVLETLRLPAANVTAIRAGQAFNWRNRTVPLMSLTALVGGPVLPVTGESRVLVVRSGRALLGVAVDAIQARVDAVVRPLDGLLAGLSGVSGATLLGDGQVLMILDPEALLG